MRNSGNYVRLVFKNRSASGTLCSSMESATFSAPPPPLLDACRLQSIPLLPHPTWLFTVALLLKSEMLHDHASTASIPQYGISGLAPTLRWLHMIRLSMFPRQPLDRKKSPCWAGRAAICFLCRVVGPHARGSIGVGIRGGGCLDCLEVSHRRQVYVRKG